MKITSVISIFILFNKFVNCSFCGSGGWVAFTDEKCFKLINELVPHEEAEEICNNQAKASPSLSFLPTLASIKSLEEQQFLKRYLFLENGAVESIWTSAKRKSDSESEFEWSDGSELEYDNWTEGNPTNNKNRKCVQIQTEFNFKNNENNDTSSINEGKWLDVPCEKRNLILCEKLQNWSFVQLQKSYIETRKNLIKSNLKLEQSKQEIIALKQNMSDLQQNPVPIGLIYVQLPDQPEPKDLWPALVWEDVSLEYAGLFFRVLGGGSAAFGETQNENSPRFIAVEHLVENCQNSRYRNSINISANAEWSEWLNLSVFSYPYTNRDCARFMASSGEVRPRNKALRIWKRTK